MRPNVAESDQADYIAQERANQGLPPAEPKQAKQRIRAIGWFLTWPQCPVTKESALEQLKQTGTLKEWVVAAELHKDEGKHLHAFIKYDKKTELTPTKWDLKEGDTTYHGNY